MHITGEAILLLVQYSYWIVLAAALFGGEELIMFFSILAGHGLLDIWKVALFGFFGILVSDIFWFFIARTALFESIKNKARGNFLYKHASNIILKFSHQNDFIYILLTKFLYGLRIISIFRVSRKKKEFWRFLIIDSSAILIWSSIMLSIGWVIGKLFFTAINVFSEIHKLIFLALGVMIALYIIESIIKHYLD